MPYQYEKEESTTSREPIADIYVVRGVEQRPQPSQELLTALERLSPAEHTMIQQLISIGFQAMVRK